MSYTIDIYRREFKPYRNVVDYLSFVAFFPHLIAGPIMRARDLLPQLARLRPLPSMETVSIALFMILFGLFQKTVLADNCGSIVEFIQRMTGKAGNPLPPGLGCCSCMPSLSRSTATSRPTRRLPAGWLACSAWN